MSGFLASGDVYFDRLIAGQYQGLSYFGNTDKLEITPTSEVKEQTSKGNADYGQVTTSVVIPGKTEIACTLTELNHENLALAFVGSNSTVNITAGTVTGEAHTAHLDKYIKLDFRNISNVVIGTLVEGTDYLIADAAAGLIKILSGGTVAEGDTLSINYSYGASTANKVTPGTEKSIKGYMYVNGYNLADDSKMELNIWEVLLTPQSGVDFKSSDFSSLELTGVLIKPVDKPAAFEILTQIS